MAIITLPSQPTTGHAIGQMLGGGVAGLGQGLGAGISNIINMKLQNMQRQQQKKNLEEKLSAILPTEKAAAFASLGVDNPSLLNLLIRKERDTPGLPLSGLFGVKSPEATKSKLAELESEPLISKEKPIAVKNFRKNILEGIKTGKVGYEESREKLLNMGFDPKSIEILLSEDLTDDVIRFFLEKTNNNPKKAKALASKYGFKV